MVSVITSSVVNVQITSSISPVAPEKRFQKDLTIGSLKGKLELMTGCSCSTMELQLMDKDGKVITIMDNDNALLGSYPVDDYSRIHVVDTDPTNKTGAFNDVSQVEKFEISQEEYAKRTDSVRTFKRSKKLGQFKEVDPEEEQRQREKKEEEERAAKAVVVGSRCEVKVPGALPKRGQVKFVGKTNFKSGWWVGVQYDEPLGKNDGSVKDKRYFECPPKYGGFVRVQDITVGDFPEEDLGFDDDEI